jgi:hypothetical protein
MRTLAIICADTTARQGALILDDWPDNAFRCAITCSLSASGNGGKRVTEMITAREVAEKSGISISTVGRTMAADPRTSAETKAKVRPAADELGYVEDLPARMMRSNPSTLIGLIFPKIRSDS